jgi:tetratricopeptide (TPR) repeat protein
VSGFSCRHLGVKFYCLNHLQPAQPVKGAGPSHKSQKVSMPEKKAKTKFFQGEILVVLALFLLAFIIRFVYLNQIKASPYFDNPHIDALWHHNWAKEIAAGDWTGKEVFFRAPLYPYFLGTLYALFGESFYFPRLIQIIIGSLSCVLIFLLGKKLFNRTTGIIASVVACLYAPMIYFDAELLIPVLIIFLDLTLILLLLRAEAKLKKRWWLLAGMALGLSAAARPNVLIFLPFVLLWICISFWNRAKNRVIPSTLFFLLGTLLIISPVTIRNWVMEKDFVLISSQGGINFYIGNSLISDGKTAIAPRMSSPLEHYKDNVWITSVRLAEESLGKKLKPSEISNFWYEQGFQFIKTYPLKFLQLLGKKFYYFWNAYEIESNQDLYFYSRWSSVMRLLVWDHLLRFPFGIICPLAILGMALNFRHWKKYFLLHAFILSYMFSVVSFFVTFRFRIPVVPFLIIFASCSIYWLVEKTRGRQYKTVLLSLGILFPLFLVTNSSLFGVNQRQLSRTYNSLGMAYSKKGQHDAAIAAYQKGLEENPNSAELHRNLGRAFWDTGRRDEAVKEYELTVSLDPRRADAYAELGYIYDRMNKDEEAFRANRRALEIDSTQVRAHISLAFLYEKRGLYEQAAKEYQEALRFEPEMPDLHNFLGYAYFKLGLEDEALIQFKTAIELDPNHADAHLNAGSAYLKRGLDQMAITHYITALRLNPKGKEAYYNLAIAYVKTKQLDRAIEVLKSGLEVIPDAVELQRLLGELSSQQ